MTIKEIEIMNRMISDWWKKKKAAFCRWMAK